MLIGTLSNEITVKLQIKFVNLILIEGYQHNPVSLEPSPIRCS